MHSCWHVIHFLPRFTQGLSLSNCRLATNVAVSCPLQLSAIFVASLWFCNMLENFLTSDFGQSLCVSGVATGDQRLFESKYKDNISSWQRLWRVSVTSPVAGFQGKVAQCITKYQLAIKVSSRRSPVASRRSLRQSLCVYHGPSPVADH